MLTPIARLQLSRMPLTFFDIKGVPGTRRERIEAAVVAGGRHTRGPHEAWIAADPFNGGFRMRHLLNTYIQADPAADLGELGEMSLTELIIETGIHDAIARKLNEKGKLSKNAIAEGIINNVRKTIIRDQLTDPKFYEEMSKLLNDLIVLKRSSTECYEEFLKKAEALVLRMAGKATKGTHPTVLNGYPEA